MDGAGYGSSKKLFVFVSNSSGSERFMAYQTGSSAAVMASSDSFPCIWMMSNFICCSVFICAASGETVTATFFICGLKKPADAQYVNDAGADYAGFVFYEKSRRNLSRQQAEEIMKKISPRIKKVP